MTPTKTTTVDLDTSDGLFHIIRQGDTRPKLKGTLLFGDEPFDLDESDPDVRRIRFRMTTMRGEEVVSSGRNVEKLDGTGRVQYNWSNEDVSKPGLYEATFIVEFKDRTKLTFPNEKEIVVHVKEQ